MKLEKKNRKKDCSSVTYTTGDIQKNIDHFNKMLSGKATNTHTDGMPKSGLDDEREINKAAEAAAKAAGTVSAASPDGSTTVSSGSDAGDSGASGDSSGDGAGVGEAIENKKENKIELDEYLGWYIKDWN